MFGFIGTINPSITCLGPYMGGSTGLPSVFHEGTYEVTLSYVATIHEARQSVTPRHCSLLDYLITSVIASFTPLWYDSASWGRLAQLARASH